MATAAEKIAALQAAHKAALQTQARNAVELQQANQSLEAAERALSELGAASPAQAEELLAQLEQELDTLLRQAAEHLRGANAGG